MRHVVTSCSMTLCIHAGVDASVEIRTVEADNDELLEFLKAARGERHRGTPGTVILSDKSGVRNLAHSL